MGKFSRACTPRARAARRCIHAHRRASVAGMQHWPGRGPRLLPRNVHASTPTTLLTFSWSQKERKKGKKKGKKSFDYTSINGDRRGFAQTIKFRVQLRLRIYEHERCARARAHETRRTVYFSEYCRGRCAPNDCLSTALRSCSDTWKYSRGRAYRNILVVWWDNRRLTGWSEMRLWEEAWIGSRAGEIAILVSSGWSWNVDEKFLIKVVTYLKKKNSKNYYENIWISLKIF